MAWGTQKIQKNFGTHQCNLSKIIIQLYLTVTAHVTNRLKNKNFSKECGNQIYKFILRFYFLRTFRGAAGFLRGLFVFSLGTAHNLEYQRPKASIQKSLETQSEHQDPKIFDIRIFLIRMVVVKPGLGKGPVFRILGRVSGCAPGSGTRRKPWYKLCFLTFPGWFSGWNPNPGLFPGSRLNFSPGRKFPSRCRFLSKTPRWRKLKFKIEENDFSGRKCMTSLDFFWQ